MTNRGEIRIFHILWGGALQRFPAGGGEVQCCIQYMLQNWNFSGGCILSQALKQRE